MADTVEVYRRGGLWFWQRYTRTGGTDHTNTPIGRTQGPFGTEAAARRNARHVNLDATLMLPASSPYR